MITVNVYLKSGQTMSFECSEIILNRNGLGELVGYEEKHGNSKRRLMELSIPDIIGLTIEEQN